MDKKWGRVLETIKTQVSSQNYRVWFSKTVLDSNSNGALIIKVPSGFVKDNLVSKFLPLISSTIETVWGSKLPIDFKVDPTLLQEPNSLEEEFELISFTPPNTLSQSGLNPKYTMNSFMVGLSNNLAYAAAQAVIQNPGLSYNPLFIYGGTGVGKTHLMQAIGNAVFDKNPNFKIIYCSSEKFMNDFIESIRNKQTGQFRAKYRSTNLLLIDDIQFISGRDSTQEEFFHTFNELQGKNSQVILTSDRPPLEIQKLEPRLKSRFQGGLMVDIQVPDFDTRMAILKAKCTEKGEFIPEECLILIAENIATNARELEGKLIQILQITNLQKEPLTADMVRNHLGTVVQKPQKLEPKKVLTCINQYFNLKMADLTGPRRKKELVLPRQLAMYLLYLECRLPFEAIGALLGGRDHTTIMHGVDKIKEAQQRDREIQRLLIEIKQIL